MSYITDIKDIDEIQKSIYRLEETCERAFKGAPDLDSKVEMERLRKEIYSIDRAFKLQRYRLEDAINYAKSATRCSTCRNIVAKHDID